MKTFNGYIVTPNGDIVNPATGEKKYTWRNQGRCALEGRKVYKKLKNTKAIFKEGIIREFIPQPQEATA